MYLTQTEEGRVAGLLTLPRARFIHPTRPGSGHPKKGECQDKGHANPSWIHLRLPMTNARSQENEMDKWDSGVARQKEIRDCCTHTFDLTKQLNPCSWMRCWDLNDLTFLKVITAVKSKTLLIDEVLEQKFALFTLTYPWETYHQRWFHACSAHICHRFRNMAEAAEIKIISLVRMLFVFFFLGTFVTTRMPLSWRRLPRF